MRGREHFIRGFDDGDAIHASRHRRSGLGTGSEAHLSLRQPPLLRQENSLLGSARIPAGDLVEVRGSRHYRAGGDGRYGKGADGCEDAPHSHRANS